MKFKRLVVAGFLDLFFPPRCYICGAATTSGAGSEVCSSCMAAVVPLQLPLCRTCGSEMAATGCRLGPGCAKWLAHQPPCGQARSCFRYAGSISVLLQRLKFQHDTGAAALLGQLARLHTPGIDSRDYDTIIPVPLHPHRLRQRGLNQSNVLAHSLFPEARSKIDVQTLIRVRNTMAQTSLDGQARRSNLRGAFEIASGRSVRGVSVCVVDDVFTTGTTALECVHTLSIAGAARVDVWTVARA